MSGFLRAIVALERGSLRMAALDADNKQTELKKTPLHALHTELGAKMVPFAGYSMPVTYPAGLIKEHQHTREKAGLFDVSHMGQAVLAGPSHEEAATALEALVPGEIVALKPGRQRYTQLLNAEGGIIDDLMVTRPVAPEDDGKLFLVVNAACKDGDYAHITANLPASLLLTPLENRALIALQGPAAAKVLRELCPEVVDLAFMAAAPFSVNGIACHVSRSGYTGEDGFEISIHAEHAEELARALLNDGRVQPVGLGARDTLRLEAGLCLYGHDIDESTSPVEADLTFSIGKRRREEGGFPGAERIRRELENGPSRLRVGMKLEGRAPAREGCEIARKGGEPLGKVTSGSFAPTIGGPIAMGYVPLTYADQGTHLDILIRGKSNPAIITPMPFAAHRYHRKTKSGRSNG